MPVKAPAGQYCFDHRFFPPRESRSPCNPHIARRSAIPIVQCNHPEWQSLCDDAFTLIIKKRFKELTSEKSV